MSPFRQQHVFFTSAVATESQQVLSAAANRDERPTLHNRPEAMTFKLFTKGHISTLFARYAPWLDPVPYISAAEVLPMRVNNYVVENLIDWYATFFLLLFFLS
jgi:hypothetical protein